MDVVLLRFVHLVALVTVVGVPLGTAIFKVWGWRRGNPEFLAGIAGVVALVDFVVVAPSVVAQAASGYLLALEFGFSLTGGWLAASLVLYGVIGVCWGVAVWSQHWMKRIAADAAAAGAGLPERYHVHMRRWLAVGLVGLVSVAGIFVLMVLKPSL